MVLTEAPAEAIQAEFGARTLAEAPVEAIRAEFGTKTLGEALAGHQRMSLSQRAGSLPVELVGVCGTGVAGSLSVIQAMMNAILRTKWARFFECSLVGEMVFCEAGVT